ncbi:DUF3500 domain-containing protein [Microbacterium karelineae]|uniref:DUF3500 domain-containing protein n=1 Tax=Microbacterium karelineae TaxID=2654283 RepID=UPI0012EAEC8B|nr:DUF3500 domain-containing protein [Microbacterium karelineae]
MSEQRDRDIDGFFSSDRVAGRGDAVTLTDESYRSFLFDVDDPHLAEWRGQVWREFAARRTDHPFVQELLADWRALYDEPFRGVTSDGSVQDVWDLGDVGEAEEPALVEAAEGALAALSPAERERATYSLDAPEWRAWSNPEFVIHEVGIRLEDLGDETVRAILRLVEQSLSPEGYARVTEAMNLNGFLGELTDLPMVMNNRSYFFAVYGDPSTGAPWGWQLFGHHVALHFVMIGGRHVVAPCFLGAEPALTGGERAPIFDHRERLALALAASLTRSQRTEAIVYDSVLDPRMPEGRLHPADERHVAGAFRDNRVIPYEGIRATDLHDAQRGLLRDIVADFHLLLREDQRRLALAEFDAHIDDTWFSWYGAADGSQPVYFRVQSPVIVAELDNHAGVWLSNTEPARFHVHTTLRLPNGNDYGHALRRQWALTHSDD